MKIEIGKEYKTRYGQKATIQSEIIENFSGVVDRGDGGISFRSWYWNGSCIERERGDDLISPWEGPLDGYFGCTDNLTKVKPAAIVDLSRATKGTIAHFRCGGSAVIEEIEIRWTKANHIGRRIRFQDSSNETCYANARYGWSYTDTGSGVVETLSPFDIIRLDEPPFDWENAINGMAFELVDGQIAHYVGKSPFYPDRYVALCIDYNGIKWYDLQELTVKPRPDRNRLTLDIPKEK